MQKAFCVMTGPEGKLKFIKRFTTQCIQLCLTKHKQKVCLRQLNNLHERTDHENVTCISFPKEYSVLPVHKTIHHPEVDVISKLALKCMFCFLW